MPIKRSPADILIIWGDISLLILSPISAAIRVVNISAMAPPKNVSQNFPLLDAESRIASWVLSPNSAIKTKIKVEKSSFQSISLLIHKGFKFVKEEEQGCQ